MKFRSYNPSDKAAIVAILHSNCPKYFVESDEKDLVEFLDHYSDDNYLVAECDGEVIGCGGHYTKAQRHGIAWVMFKSGSIGHRELLRTTDLFFKQIERRIAAEGHWFDIHISTTQLMEKLFNRYGFVTSKITKDGFGVGLDQYDMVKRFK